MTADEGKKPERVSRKGFIDWMLGTTVGGFLAAVLYPVTKYIIPPEVPETAAASVILPFSASEMVPNSGRIFRFGNRPGILVRTPEGELRAFSARCPHLDCTVQYRDDLTRIWCACHNGHFDLNGRVIAGPPPHPLEVFSVNLHGEEIHVSLET